MLKIIIVKASLIFLIGLMTSCSTSTVRKLSIHKATEMEHFKDSFSGVPRFLNISNSTFYVSRSQKVELEVSEVVIQEKEQFVIDGENRYKKKNWGCLFKLSDSGRKKYYDFHNSTYNEFKEHNQTPMFGAFVKGEEILVAAAIIFPLAEEIDSLPLDLALESKSEATKICNSL